MATIEGFRVKNYRALKDVLLGKIWSKQKAKPLSSLTAVIGKNGAGKSSLFDAFGFLADCLKIGVEEACDLRGRGGFKRIRSINSDGPIEFEVYYRQDVKALPITYEVSIDMDESGRPFVQKERLRQRRSGQPVSGRPYSFLILNEGVGKVWKGNALADRGDEELLEGKINEKPLKRTGRSEESSDREDIILDDKRKLGIATLGSLRQHPRISAFRQFIEGWYLSYFAPDAARSLPLAGAQKHLNSRGDNLGNVVQFMEREKKAKFQGILDNIAKKIPGIDKIETKSTDDGRLLLRFGDKGFTDPFFAQQMSDGTLKVFAYLLMLEDPEPPPFICIEEPENGLYHKLLETLVNEFRDHAKKKNGSQIFVTTHQPYFVDGLTPEEVWILEKGEDGFSTVKRASDDPLVQNLVNEGLPLGGLWYSDYLDKR